MMMYISVTRVKQVVTEVLEPVMKSAARESQYARNMNLKIEDLNIRFKEAKEEI